MATVPLEIVAGNTIYAHFVERTSDYYAPQEMIPGPPPEHTWRYCVAKGQGNTVYFSNKKSGESVWILPDVNAAPGDSATNAVIMKTRGTTESAASRISAGTSTQAASAAAAASNAKQGDDVVSAPVEAPAVAVAAAEGPKSVQEKLQEAIRQRLAARGGSATPTSPGVSSGLPQAAPASSATAAPLLGKTTVAHVVTAPAEKATQDVALSQTNTPPPGTAAAGGSPGGVRDRIAAWRAGKGTARTSRSSTPQASVAGDEEAARRAMTPNTVDGIEQDASNASPNRPDRLSSSTAHATQLSRPTPVRQSAASRSHSNTEVMAASSAGDESSRSLQQDFYEEKRRQMLAADEELQREKAELIRAEQLAVQRQRLAIEARAAEEENYLRIVAERRRMEEQRLAIEMRQRDKLAALLAQPEVVSMTKEAAAAVDKFVAAQEEAQQREDAAAARARSFAEAIAQSLIDAVPTKKTAAAHTTHSHNRKSDDSDSDEDRNVSHDEAMQSLLSTDTNGVKVIQYTPQVKYIGHIGGGPTTKHHSRLSASANASAIVPSSRMPQHGAESVGVTSVRHGAGTLVYDAQGTTKYVGRWKVDKKNGHGDQTTPSTAYEGRWKDDRIHGRGMLQTKTLKASLEAKHGSLFGSAIVQTHSGDTFVGRLEDNRVASPGALSLSYGDHVEWKWTTERGTGDCRVQFACGDQYVGHVENFVPSGKGAYLTVDGNEYVGDFQKGLFHGSGFFKFQNGNTYDGELRNGLFSGQGTYHAAGSYIYKGSWVDGVMHGEGTITYANGDVWQGRFEHDQRREGKYIASSVFQLPPQ